ncbi:MAG: class I mannose-6-phosphate isomerase [Clostridia bacterium]|nr:class I mannose-6-phosphate isomerase [Clostridia bacterium]
MLRPFILTPAFRSGEATPWGGDLLRARYGKNAPPQTGESLEMSVIPGLESTDGEGAPLSALIARHGQALTGTEVGDPFPLLLKLIDARDRLSVQVHPDDAYARVHEGKLGKTEAWVILEAEQGAELVYGVRDNVSRDMLRAACETGSGLGGLLRRVPVKAGDVFYIPAGMLHAICGGILLYEIQQSSDVTYRFYDWDRTDAHGKRRELHLRQALDVVRTDLRPELAVSVFLEDATCQRELLLDTPSFRLERLLNCEETPFAANPARFSVLTALASGTILLTEEQETISLNPGQTVFIPAQCSPFRLHCAHCLVSSPAHTA